jgi:uncharacterized protein HemX
MTIKMFRRSMILLLLLCVLYVSAVLTGCACHPNLEQLDQLEATKVAALAAEEEAEAKAQERMEWEGELAKKQAELKKAEEDLKAVQEEVASEGK